MSGLGDRAQGRWKSILPLLGIESGFLTGRHGPCPMCGGVDRFRFDDKQRRGTWYCTKCGAGDGFGLLCKVKGWTFVEAARAVEEFVGAVNAEPVVEPQREDGWIRRTMRDLWTAAEAVARECPVTRYLSARGIDPVGYPRMLRSMTKCRYDATVGGAKQVQWHPAMLAKIVTPDDEAVGLHRTYLNDQTFAKLDETEGNAARKVFGGHPPGSAVRLCDPGPIMGIAEGIETAMSASVLWGMPVWSALNAERLMTWQPPKDVQEVFVFADKDATFTGEAAAYGLARKLAVRGLKVQVHVPDEGDWNDVLRAMS